MSTIEDEVKINTEGRIKMEQEMKSFVNIRNWMIALLFANIAGIFIFVWNTSRVFAQVETNSKNIHKLDSKSDILMHNFRSNEDGIYILMDCFKNAHPEITRDNLPQTIWFDKAIKELQFRGKDKNKE